MYLVEEDNDKSISIQELLQVLKRSLAAIVIAGIVGGTGMFCVCRFLITPTYEANAKMIVNSRQEQTGSVTNDQITSAEKLVDTYAIIIRSQPVLELVIACLAKAGTTYTTAQLLRVVQGPKQRTCGERSSSETVKLGQPEQ